MFLLWMFTSSFLDFYKIFITSVLLLIANANVNFYEDASRLRVEGSGTDRPNSQSEGRIYPKWHTGLAHICDVVNLRVSSSILNFFRYWFKGCTRFLRKFYLLIDLNETYSIYVKLKMNRKLFAKQFLVLPLFGELPQIFPISPKNDKWLRVTKFLQ